VVNHLFRTLDYETQHVFPDERRTAPFFAGRSLGTPHDARAYLADPIGHWRPGHSALELAHVWIGAADIPPSVRAVLDTSDAYAGCRLIEGLFEREVDLGTRGRRSQTDILVLVRLVQGLGVIAVEGKAAEPFGALVRDWDDGSPTKRERLADLCRRLGLDPASTGDLRYQLLHRTVSALIEAERYGAQEALMLAHSFNPRDASLGDYQRFAASLGLDGADLNAVTTATRCGGVNLRLGWVRESSDRTAHQ
jgi:hypothetical protein